MTAATAGFIAAQRTGHGVPHPVACRALDVAPSTFYKHHRRCPTGMQLRRLVTAEFVSPGAAVVDVGISRTEAGIVGDVDFDSVQDIAGAITPMPGGTGPMTIGCLLKNTLAAARMMGSIAP